MDLPLARKSMQSTNANIVVGGIDLQLLGIGRNGHIGLMNQVQYLRKKRTV